MPGCFPAYLLAGPPGRRRLQTASAPPPEGRRRHPFGLDSLRPLLILAPNPPIGGHPCALVATTPMRVRRSEPGFLPLQRWVTARPHSGYTAAGGRWAVISCPRARNRAGKLNSWGDAWRPLAG